MPPKVAGNNSSEIGLESIGTPTYDKLDKFLDASCSAGTFEGGAITDAGSGQISIASAKGVIRTSNSDVGNLVSFDIEATSPMSLTDNSINYIYINYNSGTPVYAATTTYTNINFQSQIIIGRVYRISTKLWIGNFGQKIQDTPLRDLYRLQTLRRFEHASGDVLSTPGTRYIAITAGVYFANYDKITTAAVDTSGAGRFDTWYRNGIGGWTRTIDQASIDNGNWDDGTGTLNSLDGVNHYGVHWVYRCVDGTTHVQYGQASYTSLADAQASLVPSLTPTLTQTLCVLIGRVVIKNAAASLTETASTWGTVFESGVPTSHNDLSGLNGGTVNEYYHLTSNEYTVRNLPIVEVTGTSASMSVNTTYIANNGSLVTLTLPITAALGSFIKVEGLGAGGWKIAQNASQTMQFLSLVTTTGITGYIASTTRYDSILIRSVAGSNTWSVVEAVGEFDVI